MPRRRRATAIARSAMRRSSRSSTPTSIRATASVADALGAAVGAQTRSLGGLGAFESVSVRGAAPGHTAVLIDGVPLARIAAVTTDLGRFALDAFGEVELYRGAVPVELGGAGVGGAINLVTRLGRGERGERMRASIGAGSFGARHAARALRRRPRRGCAVVDDARLPGRDRRLHVLLGQRHAAQYATTTATTCAATTASRSSIARVAHRHARSRRPAACASRGSDQGLPGTIAQPALPRRCRRST